MAKKAFGSSTFLPAAKPVRVKAPGSYHTPKVMSPQFTSSSPRLNFRKSTSFGGMKMTQTRKGIGYSLRTGSGMSTARVSGGGSRTTTNLGNGYYTRKSRSR